MQARLIDPRDVSWEVDAPAYRVYFWRPAADSSGLNWASEEWEIRDADVGEVLDWADQDKKPRLYTVYVCCTRQNEHGLIRLFGHDPTEKT